MTDSSKVHKALADDSRAQIHRILQAASQPIDVQDLARETDLHTSTVRGHLDVLVDAGLVESSAAPVTGPGRPKLLYVATQAPEDVGAYRLLAEILASQLASVSPDPTADAVRTGAEWGAYLIDRPRPGTVMSDAEAVEALRALMDRMGFDPSIAADGELHLHQCPFADVARDHQAVICTTHLGILRGALATLGSGVTADTLTPFVTPSLCVAGLS